MRDIDALAKILKPDQIYLFHTMGKDLKRLQYFTLHSVQNGYRLVTLTGYPANEFKPPASPAENRLCPCLHPFWDCLKKFRGHVR